MNSGHKEDEDKNRKVSLTYGINDSFNEGPSFYSANERGDSLVE